MTALYLALVVLSSCALGFGLGVRVGIAAVALSGRLGFEVGFRAGVQTAQADEFERMRRSSLAEEALRQVNEARAFGSPPPPVPPDLQLKCAKCGGAFGWDDVVTHRNTGPLHSGCAADLDAGGRVREGDAVIPLIIPMCQRCRRPMASCQCGKTKP
jgi:hypothetical protein